MALPKLVFPIAIFLVVGFFLSSFFVTSGNFAGVGFSWIFAAFAVMALGYFKVKQAVLPFFSRQIHGIIAIVLAAILVMNGGFVGLPDLTASVTPTTGVEGVSSSECLASVTDELRGKSASIILNAYDAESNTPYSAAIEVPYRLYQDGVLATSGTDTIAGSISSSGLTVGDVISIYGGNATYYLDSVTNLCIRKQEMPVPLVVHTVVDESDMATTAYDDTGSTALDSPSGTYSAQQEDYEFDMGADDEQRIYVKLKVNVANEAYQLGGICVKMYEGVADTIDDVKLNQAGWSEVIVPNYLANTVISLNDSTETSNTTDGYDKCWKPSSPMVMSEWDDIKYEYVISTGSGVIAEDDDATPTATTVVIIGHFDAQDKRGDDGTEYNDFYEHDSSEGNVGLVEDLHKPLGGEASIVIELK